MSACYSYILYIVYIFIIIIVIKCYFICVSCCLVLSHVVSCCLVLSHVISCYLMLFYTLLSVVLYIYTNIYIFNILQFDYFSIFIAIKNNHVFLYPGQLLLQQIQVEKKTTHTKYCNFKA